MRELLLLCIVGVLSIAAVAKPQFGVMAYIWFSLMRPDYIAFSTGQYSYSMMLAIGMILGSWREIGKARAAWFTNPFSWLLVLLQIPILLSTQTSLLPGYSLDKYLPFLKMTIAVLWLPVLIHNVTQMRLLFLVTAVSLGAHAFWQSLGGIVTGGRAIQHGIGGFMSENNTFAVGLIMVFPFCWYARYLVEQKWLKMVMTGASVSTLFAVMLTHSRGAAVAAVAVLLVLLIHSKRRTLVFLFLLAASVPGLYLVRETYFARLGTIENYTEDGSAMSRLVLNKVALQVWLEHPLTGVGIGEENFFQASVPFLKGVDSENLIGLVVHNSFLQILVHCGIGALLLYLLLFCGVVWAMWRSSRRLAVTHPGLEYYPRAIELSAIAYLVASLTQPRATFDFAYTVAMYAAAWYAIEKRLTAQDVPAPLPAFTVPPSPVPPAPPTPPAPVEAARPRTRLLGRQQQRSR